MVTGFLITILIVLVINIVLNMIALSFFVQSKETVKIVQMSVSIFIYLILITWNILALLN